jgi:hypothetical protein
MTSLSPDRCAGNDPLTCRACLPCPRDRRHVREAAPSQSDRRRPLRTSATSSLLGPRLASLLREWGSPRRDPSRVQTGNQWHAGVATNMPAHSVLASSTLPAQRGGARIEQLRRQVVRGGHPPALAARIEASPTANEVLTFEGSSALSHGTIYERVHPRASRLRFRRRLIPVFAPRDGTAGVPGRVAHCFSRPGLRGFAEGSVPR